MVSPAATDTGRRLGAVDHPLGMLFVDALVESGFVVESRNIHLVGELVTDGVIPVVEGRRGGASRVFFVKQPGKPPGLFPAIRALLFRNLIADAPQDDARMVPVAPYHVAQVPL